MRHPEGRVFEMKALERADLEKAYEHTRRRLDKDAIKPESFIGVSGYNAETIKRDIASTKRKSEQIEKGSSPQERENKRMADIFEGIMHEHVELSDWLGPEVFTVKTSEYDDYFHGVDMVIEFPQENGEIPFFALAVDVTYGADLKKKFDRIENNIKEGRMAEVTYFSYEDPQDQDKPPVKKPVHIPHVVLGVESKIVKELAGYILEKGGKENLGKHPVQAVIIDELQQELTNLAAYASSVGKKQIAEEYNKLAVALERSLEEKEHTDLPRNKLNPVGDLIHDKVFSAIKQHMDELWDISHGA